MNRTLIIVIVVLVLFYSLILYASTIGWGYAGYRGFYYGPSFWYWGGPRYYIGPSVRSGSIGGPGHRGGGPGSGK